MTVLSSTAMTGRRWAAARGVLCRVKGDPFSVEQFRELVSEPDFDKKLEAAIEKPNAAESSRLMQRVLPLLNVSGQKVPFSATSKSLAISKMVALIHFARLPLWFWTISPSDIDSVPALRIAGMEYGMEYPLPSLQQRAQCIASNPAAAARAFQLLINSVLCNIFGLQPAADTKKSSSIYCSQARQQKKCLLCGGHCIAYFAVTETLGRGALHMHGCLFCSVQTSPNS